MDCSAERYLLKYIGIYRILAEYDLEKNDFIRDENGAIDPTFDDLYIPCKNKAKIRHYSRNILYATIYSQTRLKKLINYLCECLHIDEEDRLQTLINNKIILYIDELSDCYDIYFYEEYISLFAKHLVARTNGASIDPFSIKNLPQLSYEITEEEEEEYKQIVSILNGKISILKKTAIDFIIQNKKLDIDNLKAMKLKPKEYICYKHCWKEYLKYLRLNIKKYI